MPNFNYYAYQLNRILLPERGQPAIAVKLRGPDAIETNYLDLNLDSIPLLMKFLQDLYYFECGRYIDSLKKEEN